MKKSRIIIPCVSAVLLLGLGAVVLVPRMQMQYFWKQQIEPMMSCCAEGMLFTEYDLTDDSLVPVKLPEYTVGIPADCSLSDDGEYVLLEEVDIYVSEDAYTVVELPQQSMAPSVSFEDLDLAAYSETRLPFQGNAEKGLEALGFSTPLSDYEEHCAAVMLRPDEYPFWNLDAATAFCKLAIYKGMDSSSCSEVYVYETNEVKGVVYCIECSYTDSGKKAYSMHFRFYAPYDLNTPHELSVIAPTREEALAVINSITIG